jgi:hypothetical protein
VAFFDIKTGYVGEDSPRFDVRTLNALDRRKLIQHDRNRAEKKARGVRLLARVTTKAYFPMVRFEVEAHLAKERKSAA